MKNRITKWLLFVIAFCAVVVLSVLGQETAAENTSPAYAAELQEAPELTQKASLTLTYAVDGAAQTKIKAAIYRVASLETDAAGSLSFERCGDFADAAVELNGQYTAEEWDVLAQTLEAYAAAGGIYPEAEAVSVSDGAVTFDGLESGLYLIVSADTDVSDGESLFSPALVSLPDKNAQGEWQLAVNVSPKGRHLQSDGGQLTYQAVKLWKADNAAVRPEEIDIFIVRDGSVQSRQTLSADNGWTYTWTAADDGSVWHVAEAEVPKGYTVTVERRQTAFLLTNTYSAEPSDAPAKDDGDGAKNQKTEAPVQGLGLVNPKTGDVSRLTRYAVLSACAGLCLLLLGIGFANRQRESGL